MNIICTVLNCTTNKIPENLKFIIFYVFKQFFLDL